MATETVGISREEYKLLLEKVGILRNPKIVEAVEENDNIQKLHKTIITNN